jgi:polyphenol oxidase
MSDWIVPDWPAPSNVKALFSTRTGGTGSSLSPSPSPFASFNLGDHVGDDPLTVKQNRDLLGRLLPNEPRWLKQIHGTGVICVDGHDCGAPPSAPPIGDAAFSRHPRNVCAVLVADCLAILLCDRSGTMVAVIHAGWRGLAGKAIENMVSAIGTPPAALMAWLGPAIGPNHFEVGEEVRQAFVTNDERSDAAFIPHSSCKGKWFADLFLLARQQLLKAGVTEVYGGGVCTFSDPGRFFSYRRDGSTGRMAGLIWLAPQTTPAFEGVAETHPLVLRATS